MTRIIAAMATLVLMIGAAWADGAACPLGDINKAFADAQDAAKLVAPIEGKSASVSVVSDPVKAQFVANFLFDNSNRPHTPVIALIRLDLPGGTTLVGLEDDKGCHVGIAEMLTSDLNRRLDSAA